MKQLSKILAIILFIVVLISIVTGVLGYETFELTFYSMLLFVMTAGFYIAMIAAEINQDEYPDNWFNYEQLQDEEDYSYHPDRD